MAFSLHTKVGSVVLKTPFIAASGTWAYGLEYLDHPLQNYLGAFVTKSLSVSPSEGNPTPRIYETEAGMLNSIGLQNMGMTAFLTLVEPKLKKAKSPYILSIYGQRLEDFRTLAAQANDSSALGIELNISCPNIDKGGLEFSCDSRTTEELVKSVRREIKKPLWVKLSPNVTAIQDIAMAAEAGGADGLTLINTLLGMAIDIEAQKPWLGRKVGGLSGPAIKPVAVERLYRCYQRVKIPLIGSGGVRCGRDAIEFFLAGASAVQVGTWNFRDPFVYERLCQELSHYGERKGYKSVADMRGLAHNAISR